MHAPRRVIMLFVFLCIAFVLLAEIAPEEYRNMQLGAPDVVDIRVLKVKTSRPLFSRNITVQVNAQVIGVERSLSNLSEGDRITILYEHYKMPKRGWTGPRPIPILRKGEESIAFIRFDQEASAYVPAARGASFDPLIPLI